MSAAFPYIALLLGGAALVLMLRWMDRVEARLLDLEEDAAFMTLPEQHHTRRVRQPLRLVGKTCAQEGQGTWRVPRFGQCYDPSPPRR
jgi:hypothetical protein